MLTIVAPDLVPSGDVCLGEYCCGVAMAFAAHYVQLMREACARG